MKRFLFCAALAALTGLTCPGIAAEGSAPASVPFAAAVKQDGKWGAVNGEGRWIIPPAYDKVALSLSDEDTRGQDLESEPGRDLLIEVRQSKLRGFYDRTGKEIVPVSYTSRSSWTDGALAVENEQEKILFYRKDGTRIGKIYNQVSDFKNGMAIIKENGKYGYLASDGSEIAPVYEEARYFADGLAPVKTKGLWGVIDAQGNTVVDPVYRDTGPFYSDGLLAVKNKEDLWGFIDETGAETIPLIYRSVIPAFSEHLTAVQDQNKRWGFADSEGNITAAPQFTAVLTPFSEGLAGVATVDGNAYVKPDGTTAFAADYERLFPFEGGIAEVGKGEVRPAGVSGGFPISIGIGWGWGGRHHHRRHSPGWGWGIGFPIWSNPPYTGYEPISTIAVKRGYIDNTGKVIAAPSLSQVYKASEKGILVFNDSRYGWVNRSGVYIAHTVYKTLIPKEEANALIGKDEENRWGVLSMETGQEEIPFLYKEIRYLGENLFAYKADGKWGLIGKDGKPVTEAVYRDVSLLSEGLLPVKTKDGWKYIAPDGSDRIAPEKLFSEALPFSGGRAGVKLNGKWGLIDTEGRFVLPASYEQLTVL